MVKAFDNLWLEESINDLFDNMDEDKRDDNLKLIYESNSKNLVSVKTPTGCTERIEINNIVQQGECRVLISIQIQLIKLERSQPK